MSRVNSLICHDVGQLNIALKDADLEHYQTAKGHLAGTITHINLENIAKDSGKKAYFMKKDL